jgi:hypothetical protein
MVPSQLIDKAPEIARGSDFGVQKVMVADVIPVETARASLEIRGAVAVGDAEFA